MPLDMAGLLKALDEIEPGRLHFLDRKTGKVLTVIVEDKPGLEKMKKLLAAEPSRYSQVPKQEARQNFVELEQYVAQLTDPHLQALLKKALVSHRPFREFRDILERRTTDKRVWDAYHRKNLEERAQRFLKSIGVHTGA